MPPAIDTLKVSHRLQSAGMPRKQADVVVEALAGAVSDRPSKDAVLEAVETLGTAMDRRFAAVDKQHLVVRAELDELKTGQAELRTGQDELRTGQDEIRTGQAELRTGQAELRTGQDELRTGQAELRTGQAHIMSLLSKLLDGQAVLHQNGMELKRRLDERKP